MGCFKASEKRVTLVNSLEDILWNISFIACNPKKDHKGKNFLLAYHVAGEIVLIALVIVEMFRRDIDLSYFSLCVIYFTVLGQTIVKLCSLNLNKEVFCKIIKVTEQLWDSNVFPECRQQYDRNLNLITNAFIAYKIFFGAALLMHIVVPVCYKAQIIITWLPFETKLLETSWIHLLGTSIWQIITFGYSVWFSVIYSDCLFGLLLTGAILQFRLLQHAFQTIGTLDVSDKQKEKMYLKYIDYHRVLFEYIKNIENLFKYPILCQLTCCVLAMCVSAYLFADVKNDVTSSLTILSYAFCNIFEMLLYCGASQTLQTESELVSDAIYFSGWHYSYNRNIRHVVAMVISRSQRTCKITAWLIDLTLEVFVQVLQFSFSLYTILQNTKSK